MNVTTTGLTKAAGIAAAAAGAVFIAVQINHPGMTSYLTDTHEWVVRCIAKAFMCALALAGITGMYLRQVRQMRVFGLVAYVTFAVGYLLMLCTVTMAAAFLPALTDTAPQFVNDVIAANEGGTPVGSIGHLQVLFNITGACYMLGGLAFGIALFRARVLARWAALLLAASTVGTAALAVLPESFNRPMAVPEGVAMIGLGVSLWLDQRGGRTHATDPSAVRPAADQSVTVR
jgi:hypothetical protein